jgi:hypothetical protein
MRTSFSTTNKDKVKAFSGRYCKLKGIKNNDKAKRSDKLIN